MARGLVYDLTRQDAVEAVLVADRDPAALANIQAFCPDPRITVHELDLTDAQAVHELMLDADGAICAAHYGLNVELTRLAIGANCHLVDLGGNNDVVAAQLAMDSEARDAGVSVIPDCGLAPGMASLLVAWGARHLPWATAAHIRVGGLPRTPEEPFRYGRLFNVQGLINEYVEVPIAHRDGTTIELQPLGDIEHLEVAQLGTLEAFNTSGGVSTLPQSLGDRFKDIDYKTLRYPGHAHAMRWLYGLGLMDWEPVDLDGQQVSPRALLSRQIVAHVPPCEDDVTVVVVRFVGNGREHRLQIVDTFDADSGLTAMMRTTAFPASIVAQMQCSGQVAQYGACPQELAIDPDRFLDALTARGIPLEGRLIPAAQ